MNIEKKNQRLTSPVRSFLSDFFENDPFWGSSLLAPQTSTPAVNIKETDKNYQLEIATPGIPKENIHVGVENNMLTISGDHKYENKEQNTENGRYTRKEFGYSSFERSFRLPENADTDKINANVNNGVLNLTIPKTEMSVKKKEIKIG